MTDNIQLFKYLENLNTEQRNTKSIDVDSYSVLEILEIINDEDKTVADAVRAELPYIEQAVTFIVNALKHNGRFIYIGAGTSGRLGIIDAAECPPTFGTRPELIIGLIAGGEKAVFHSQEGAEDREEYGENDLKNINISASDVVCGLAASSRTPYVIGGLRYAHSIGAKTIFLTTNPRHDFNIDVDIAICPNVGPEVIMGSTRMKSGTAQKMVINMLTTTSMIRLGKVYENMMIDLQLTNNKLVERAKRILMMITNVTYDEASRYLEISGGHVKKAIVMIKAGVSSEEAEARLLQADGFVRAAIENKKYSIG